MQNRALILAAALLAYAAWRYSLLGDETGDEAQAVDIGADSANGLLADAGDVLTGATQTAAQFVDNISGGILKVSAMANVPRSILGNENVQAILRVIRAGEGTADENGYRRMFGGQLFGSFADHPRQKITRTLGGKPITSTAAGAYQFLASSWDETKRIMGLSDFSPASQDYAAVGRIAARGALEDVIAGRFDTAIRKIAREWASMPGSPYGQPVISIDRARSIYASAGGEYTTA